MDMKNKAVRIAILSGKGGTGKTLVSVNLAAVAQNSLYIDCDVEEPNGHLFFKPEIVDEQDITVKIPVVNESLCTGCRKCVDFCKFNAIAFIKSKPVVFDEICHSCGGCMLLCPEKAISEKKKVIGKVQKGISRDVTVTTGILNTGEASGIPIIKKLLEENTALKESLVFIDCPPGSACIVMESIKDADYCILVAEPTVFGVHNLNMVYDLVRLFDKPLGVVLNKCLEGDNPAESFCTEIDIPILCRIPFDNELGMLNSDAKIVAWESERFKVLFSNLLESVKKEAQYETAVNP
jgi:MinD superfamily P-loop ATPase